jgi:hypothetical protein
MRSKETQALSGLPMHQKRDEDLSRRKFLKTAVAAGTVAAIVPITGIALTGSEEHSSNREDPMETILKRYGSEFGPLNQTG